MNALRIAARILVIFWLISGFAGVFLAFVEPRRQGEAGLYVVQICIAAFLLWLLFRRRPPQA